MKLYFDEAGNTGTQLLNKDQPVAVLASTSLGPTVCTELIAPLIRQGQMEAKYSRLRGSTKGQQDLLQLFSADILTRETVKAEVADKRFSLVAHLVDKLIEPAIHAMGSDLTDGDAQIAYANMLYYAGPHMLPKGGWDTLLETFANAIHRPSVQAFDALRVVLRGAVKYACDNKETSEPLIGLFMASELVDEYVGGLVTTTAFDPMPNLFASLINYWMRQTPNWFDVTHDQSKPMKKGEEHLRKLMTQLQPQQFGHGARMFELPLRISTLTFEDSKGHPPLQVADLIAGGVMDVFSARFGYKEFTSYHQELWSTQLRNLIIDGIVPSTDVSPENEAQDGDMSITDGVTTFLEQAKAARGG